MFGESRLTARLYALAIAGERRPQLGMGVVVLLRALEVFRGVHRDPDALVAEGVELPLRCQLGECRLLVVAALGQPLERLVVEDVDAGVDPVRQARRFAKTAHTVAVRELDHAELRRQRSDD